jgi:hypothetical protein
MGCTGQPQILVSLDIFNRNYDFALAMARSVIQNLS